MKNKKAWVRIVEAFIAITLLFSVFITIYVRQSSKIDISEEIYSLQEAILKQISNSESLRSYVLNNNTEAILEFIDNTKLVPPSLNYTIKICNLDEICSMDSYQKEVFASETVISSTLTEYSPKVIKIFMWKSSK